MMDIYEDLENAFYHLECARVRLSTTEDTQRKLLCYEVEAAKAVTSMVLSRAGSLVDKEARRK